jgi:hypothetical protein
MVAKQGTAVRNIRLDHENAEFIEGKVDGQTIVIITQREENIVSHIFKTKNVSSTFSANVFFFRSIQVSVFISAQLITETKKRTTDHFFKLNTAD